ncbi:cell division protein ZipA [Colwelliaceae bacterium BS250]
MEVNFRLILIVISVVAIVGIYLNGRYKIRKGKNPYKLKSAAVKADIVADNAEQSRLYDNDGFDSDGVGRVKAILDDFTPKEPPSNVPTPPTLSEEDCAQQTTTIDDIEKFDQTFSPVTAPDDQAADHAQVTEPEKIAKPLQSEVAAVAEPVVEPPVKRSYSDTPIYTDISANESDELPSINALEQDNVKLADVVEEPKTVAEKVVDKVEKKISATVSKLKPKTKAELKRDQLEIDFDAAQGNRKAEIEQEVLALSVVVNDNQAISGAALLPSLLTLGMRFGEMNIFHRHQDNAGKGQITFSIANMVNPGTFDLDNMEMFTTKGLTLFMTLPNAGDSAKVFKLMLSAAKQLAAEFGGQVLDGKRSVMTKQTEQHYISKIREFDRKSRLAGY